MQTAVFHSGLQQVNFAAELKAFYETAHLTFLEFEPKRAI